MENLTTEVMVVGAGPAGCMAALELARSGVEVMLLEREHLPREKTCAGVLSLKSFRLLEPFLGDELGGVCEDQLRHMTFTHRFVDPIHAEGPLFAYTVKRGAFDQLLAGHAVAAGARLMEGDGLAAVSQQGDSVCVRTAAGRSLRARYAVAADGVFSATARSLGVPRGRLAPAVEAVIALPRQGLDRFAGRAVIDYGCSPSGYGWVFPKRDAVSVGLGSFSHRAVPVRRHFFQFLETILPEAARGPIPLHGHPVPVGGRNGPRRVGRVLLAGDAAGLADPFIGEGIYYALRSGQLAAAAIQGLLAHRVEPDWYERRIEAEIGRELQAASRFAHMFYACPGFFHRRLVVRPRITAQFAALVAGEQSFQEVFPWLARYLVRGYLLRRPG